MPDDKKAGKISVIKSLEGLDDLDKGEVFSFRGKEHTIPAISQDTAEKMSVMHGGIKKALDEEDIESAAKFDIEYAHTAMSAGMSENESKELMKELREWPKQVLGKISRFIATNMMGPIDELIEEPEEKAAAKK